MIRFGPAGGSQAFYDAGFESSLDMPLYLSEVGLNAYEYQCGRGVRVKEDFCRRLKDAAQKHDIYLTIHSPYFINLATPDPKVMDSSLEHLSKTLTAADWMGAERIVVHPGSVGKGNTRQEALSRAEALLDRVIDELLPKFPGIKLCLETMGKINQLGTLEEVLHLCKLNPAFIPTIDFGHLHSRGIGAIKGSADYREILDRIDAELGYEVVRYLHVHFSPIEYSKGGEVRHRTMAEGEYGPYFEDLAMIIAAERLEPVIISESAGTQTEDALAMQVLYNQYSPGEETAE